MRLVSLSVNVSAPEFSSFRCWFNIRPFRGTICLLSCGFWGKHDFCPCSHRFWTNIGAARPLRESSHTISNVELLETLVGTDMSETEKKTLLAQMT